MLLYDKYRPNNEFLTDHCTVGDALRMLKESLVANSDSFTLLDVIAYAHEEGHKNGYQTAKEGN